MILELARIAITSKDAFRYLRQYASQADAFQDLCLYIWERRHTYDPARSAPSTWVRWVARTAFVRGLRYGSNAGVVSLRQTAGSLTPPTKTIALPEVASPDRRLAHIDAHDEVITLLRNPRLMPSQQRIMERIAVGDDSEMISARFGVTRTYVNGVKHKSLKVLRRAA